MSHTLLHPLNMMTQEQLWMPSRGTFTMYGKYMYMYYCRVNGMTKSPFGQTAVRFKTDRNAKEIPGDLFSSFSTIFLFSLFLFQVLVHTTMLISLQYQIKNNKCMCHSPFSSLYSSPFCHLANSQFFSLISLFYFLFLSL